MYHIDMMKRVLVTCVLLCSVILAAPAVAYEGGELKLPNPDGPAFPRLAMWHPSFDSSPLEDCARYDMAIGDFQVPLYWDPALGTFGENLKIYNPEIKLYTYFTNTVIRHSSLWGGTRKNNPYLGEWPDKWFLTESGTTTAVSLDEKTEVIFVNEWTQTGPVRGSNPPTWDIFRVDHDVLCDGEIMTVVGVDAKNNAITVIRGMNGTRAKEHAPGARIAPILRFWAGSYIMNITDDCPKVRLHNSSKEELYSEYSIRMSKREREDWWHYIGGKQDGFLFDLMADKLSWVLWANTRSVDIDQDNQSDAISDMDAKWIAGIDRITGIFRKEFRREELVRNNCRGRRYDFNNGENFESWPHFEWANYEPGEPRGKTKYWHRYFFGHPEEERGGIIEFVKYAEEPNFTLMETADYETDLDIAGHPELLNPDKPNMYKPNYQKMRWGLTSALLAGVYYCYVIHTDGHGQLGLLWFDEYDLGRNRQGYLGYPVGPIQKMHIDMKEPKYGAWGREYQHGFVLCNPLDYEVEIEVPHGPWQRIRGHQDLDVNTGELVEGKVKVGAYDGLILIRPEDALVEDDEVDDDDRYRVKL